MGGGGGGGAINHTKLAFVCLYMVSQDGYIRANQGEKDGDGGRQRKVDISNLHTDRENGGRGSSGVDGW